MSSVELHHVRKGSLVSELRSDNYNNGDGEFIRSEDLRAYLEGLQSLHVKDGQPEDFKIGVQAVNGKVRLFVHLWDKVEYL